MKDKDNDLAKILLPEIRKIMPTILAEEIVGVQPMQNPEWKTGENRGQIQQSEFWVEPPINLNKLFDIVGRGKIKKYTPPSFEYYKWCEDFFGPEYVAHWYRNENRYYFMKEEDRTAFMLKWT